MKRSLFAVVFLLVACRAAPPVPVNRQLMRVEAPWTDAGGSSRTAPATILVFRSSHEFVEVHCVLIERGDTLYIVGRAPRVSVVGEWRQKGSNIEADRRKVAHSRRENDVYCQQPRLKFRITANSVAGSDGTYSPVTRLVAPEFETFVNAAKQSPVTCPPGG